MTYEIPSIQLLIVNQLRKARKSRGVTQGDVSERVNIERTILSELENNKRKLTLDEFIAICVALNIEPRELMPTLRDLKGISQTMAVIIDGEETTMSLQAARLVLALKEDGGTLDEWRQLMEVSKQIVIEDEKE